MFKNSKKILLICFLLLFGVFAFMNYVPAKTEVISDMDNNNKPTVSVMSSFAEFSIPELFGYSDIVISGKVESISDSKEGKLISLKDAARNDGIYKDFTFKVEETLKGGIQPGNLITIRVLGGETEKFKLITDTVRPELNKQQILFLKEYNDIVDSQETTYTILTPRGKFKIEKEKNQAINDWEESQDIETLKDELKKLRNENGDKIILPKGVLR